MIVILNIVLVIGRRDKNRIQVQDLHAQILQIVELLPDPFQIAAVKIPHIHRLGRCVPVRDLVRIFIQVHILPGLHIA